MAISTTSTLEMLMDYYSFIFPWNTVVKWLQYKTGIYLPKSKCVAELEKVAKQKGLCDKDNGYHTEVVYILKFK